MNRITLRDFDWTISAPQKTLFAGAWPDGAAPTLKNALKARDAGLSLICAAKNLLRGEHLVAFFVAIHAPRCRYRETLEPHIARLKELWKVGDRGGHTLAEMEFERHKREHWALFQEEVAIALVEEFRKQEEGVSP